MTERSLVDKDKALEKSVRELETKYLGEDLVNELTAPTPQNIIATRPIRGGGQVSYVPGPHFIRKLNRCFGFLWSYEVPQAFELDGQIVGRGRLTVNVPYLKKRIIRRFKEDSRDVEEESLEYEMLSIVKEQFGSSEIKKYGKDTGTHKAGQVIDLGDDYKGMGTDAFKKCATELGVFLDVYESRGGGEGVSQQQFNAFYMRAEAAGMDKEQADKWGQEQIGKPKEQWSEMEIMELIPLLLDMEEKKED